MRVVIVNWFIPSRIGWSVISGSWFIAWRWVVRRSLIGGGFIGRGGVIGRAGCWIPRGRRTVGRIPVIVRVVIYLFFVVEVLTGLIVVSVLSFLGAVAVKKCVPVKPSLTVSTYEYFLRLYGFIRDSGSASESMRAEGSSLLSETDISSPTDRLFSCE